MDADRSTVACPLCGQRGRVQFTTRPAPIFPPLNLPVPLLQLSQCQACGAVFAKTVQPSADVPAEQPAGTY
jgi:hypothetical protein